MKEKIGKKFYSPYFKQMIEVVEYVDDNHWIFKLENGEVYAAKTPLSYFEGKGLKVCDVTEEPNEKRNKSLDANKVPMKEKIEEILIRNNDWNADDEEVEISGVEFSRETTNDVINELTDYITENYQPKTTSTDIEELRKEFMRKFTREIFEAVDVGEGQGDVVPVGLEIEPDALPEEIWNFFLPHLSNKSELKSAEHIKREAVEGFVKWFEESDEAGEFRAVEGIASANLSGGLKEYLESEEK